MTNPLNSFWLQLAPDSPKPYIHPADQDLLKKHSRWVANYAAWDEFISDPEWNRPKVPAKLQVSLVPVPYVGDLLGAKVLILMLNPGFLPLNIWAEGAVPEWPKILWKNLHQSFDSSRPPFVFLDPEFAWHPGFIYWSSRFKKTLLRIMEVQKLSYLEALKWLATKVAILQLIPYSSASCDLPEKMIRSLPSVQTVQAFARETLFQQALSGEKLLIVARRDKIWGLPSHENIIRLSKVAARGAHIENDPQVRAHLWEKLGL